MNERDDQLHDPALSGLYRQAVTGQPPASIDAAILAAARQAVQPVPPASRPWWKRLRAPVAVAATVMLAVMLSLTVERHPPAPPMPPPVLEEQAPAPVERREPAPVLPHAGQVQPKASTPVSRADNASAKPQALVPSPVAKERAAPAEIGAMESKRELPPPASPPMEMRDALRATPSTSGVAAPGSPEKRSAEQFEAKQKMPAVAPAMRAAKPAVLAPEAWVEQIRALRREGRLEEAARRLDELRRVYPEFSLPEDLR